MMTSQRTIGIIVGVIVVAIAASVAAFTKPPARGRMPTNTPPVMTSTGSPSGSPTTTSTTSTMPTISATSYTAAQVATHNTESNCWASINGSVYNLTDWIAQHPGGERAIIRLCGTDGSAAFNQQHGGQGAPTQALSQFKIGALAQ